MCDDLYFPPRPPATPGRLCGWKRCRTKEYFIRSFIFSLPLLRTFNRIANGNVSEGNKNNGLVVYGYFFIAYSSLIKASNQFFPQLQ